MNESPSSQRAESAQPHSVADSRSLLSSILRGAIGFTLLSVAGFAPWVLAGRYFYRTIGEAGLYAVCAIVFIVLSAPLLHRLLRGPGSFWRFYKIFGLSFAGYSVAWTVGWMLLGGHTGSLVGLLAGCAVMGVVLTAFFRAWPKLLPVIAILFLANTAGYFIGGWIEGELGALRNIDSIRELISKRALGTVGKALWGVFYGLGFGAGLGAAFHLLQNTAAAARRGVN